MKKLYNRPAAEILVFNPKENLLIDSVEVKVYGGDNVIEDPFDNIANP